MWEWQYLFQITHLCVVSGRMELRPSFLRARLSVAAVISLSVDNLYVSQADIFISQVKVAGDSLPQCQFTVDDVFWDATILHTADMAQPSQSALSKQSVRTGKTSMRQDISAGYFVLPGYAQDTSDASQVECVEPSPLHGIYNPCLAAMQKCAGNSGIVDNQICLHRQHGACPYSSRETSES